MKKFSRMPKSESGGGGGGAGALGAGSAGNFTSGGVTLGRCFTIGRHQVTVEELVAEGNLLSHLTTQDHCCGLFPVITFI